MNDEQAIIAMVDINLICERRLLKVEKEEYIQIMMLQQLHVLVVM